MYLFNKLFVLKLIHPKFNQPSLLKFKINETLAPVSMQVGGSVVSYPVAINAQRKPQVSPYEES
jgi:hypothetical protein